MKKICVIPCRYSSSRLPGKPLKLIGDMPMMWHVYQKAIISDIFDEIIIATDNEMILRTAENLNLNAIMTSEKHKTGTDRLVEVSEKIDSDIYVNLQGDEPFVSPELIQILTNKLLENKDTEVLSVNAYEEISTHEDILSLDTVKVIFSKKNNLIALSRLPIPSSKLLNCKYYKHLGIYSFTKKGLRAFSSLKPSYLEKSENIEMYRLLENDYRIKMVESKWKSIGVDTYDDLKKSRVYFQASNSMK